jgi:DSF synthase
VNGPFSDPPLFSVRSEVRVPVDRQFDAVTDFGPTGGSVTSADDGRAHAQIGSGENDVNDPWSNPTEQPAQPVLRSDSVFFDFFETRFDSRFGVLWIMMKPTCPRKFTRELLQALRNGQQNLEERLGQQVAGGVVEKVNYQVLGSRIPGVFSYGGDISLFRELIEAQDRQSLVDYALACIEVLYTNAMNYSLPITTISLIQGDALGGGLEAALAANVVVAERGCKMGLPEILFNLFPGMGAYQLLSQRMTPVRAEQFITSGRTYTSEELHETGLVDILAEPGRGEEAVRDFIKSKDGQRSGRQALRAAMRESRFLDFEELRRVAHVWADCALNLSTRDRDVLDFLIKSQAKRHEAASTAEP